jgi:hypothetical protein
MYSSFDPSTPVTRAHGREKSIRRSISHCECRAAPLHMQAKCSGRACQGFLDKAFAAGIILPCDIALPWRYMKDGRREVRPGAPFLSLHLSNNRGRRSGAAAQGMARIDQSDLNVK